MPRRIQPFSALAPAALVAALVAAARPAAGQGILNVERYRPGDVSGLYFGLEGSLSLTGGNARVLDLSGTGMVGERARRSWIRLIAGGKYLRTNGRGVLDDRFAHLRFTRELTPRLSSFHFLQLQASESIRLSERELVGSGMRATLLDGQAGSLDGGPGLMLELERRSAAPGDSATLPRTRVWRMADLAVGRLRLGPKATLLDVAYVQPRLDDFGDLRVLDDLDLLVPVTTALKLTVSAEWRHDSRPPAGVHPDDLTLRTGVSVLIP